MKRTTKRAPAKGAAAKGAAKDPKAASARGATQGTNADAVEMLLGEVEALYCAGPAGGAGVRRRVTPRLTSASCLVERSLVPTRVSFLGETR